MSIRFQSGLFAAVVFFSVFLSNRLVLSERRAPEEESAILLTAVGIPLRGGDTDARTQPPRTPSGNEPSRAQFLRMGTGDGEADVIPVRPALENRSSPESRPLPEKPAVRAAAFLLRDLDSPYPLLESNAFHRWPTASLTKLMTAIVAFEKIGPGKPVPVSERAAGVDGQRAGLLSGETYTALDLIKAMLVVSANDAAEALAEFYGRDAFIEAMTEKAVSLGMHQTTFADPSGLSTLNQSTAGDLDKLAVHMFERYPDILAFSREPRLEVAALHTSKIRTLANINQFAGQARFLGGKTGFTDEAKGNLISLFEYKGRRLLTIVLGSEDRFGETNELYDFAASR